jgi:hypothetical protein
VSHLVLIDAGQLVHEFPCVTIILDPLLYGLSTVAGDVYLLDRSLVANDQIQPLVLVSAGTLAVWLAAETSPQR